MLANFKSLLDLTNRFKNEKDCIKYMQRLRWNDEVKCAHCNSEHVYSFKDGVRHKCKACQQQFTVRIGTIFQDSKIPLRKWFIAIYLCTARKKGLSSIQLSKEIGVTQKTAWFMLHRIREGLKDKNPAILDGVCELDETYVGGKNKNRHFNKKIKGSTGRSSLDKIPVFGILQRDGILRTFKVKDTTGYTLKPIIYKNIASDSTIHTDEYKSYNGLEYIYNHGRTDHAKGQYVIGDSTTNRIENAWSHLKRTILGTYHWTSRKHITKYLQEFDFRYNTRHLKEDQRFNWAMLQMEDVRLKYRELIKL